MCLEDLKLGRGRRAGRINNAANYGAVNVLLPANYKRVALVVSVAGGTATTPPTSDYAQLYSDSSLDRLPFVSITNAATPVVLRIEDLGDLITGAISGQLIDTGGLASAFLTVTEITTETEAAAI